MGGRGASSGMAANSPITGRKETVIETTYFSMMSIGGARYKDTVLEATADNNGNVNFSYAKGEFSGPSAKTNKTQTVTYKLKAGAVNGETFGIDWDKVKSISGETYSLRRKAKEAGLKWDGKRWARK